MSILGKQTSSEHSCNFSDLKAYGNAVYHHSVCSLIPGKAFKPKCTHFTTLYMQYFDFYGEKRSLNAA